MLSQSEEDLSNKLKSIKWSSKKLEDLFESSNGNFDIKKEHINGLGEYVVTAGLGENGILGKTNVDSKIFDGNTLTVDMFGNAFYRNFRYKMVTHARVFSLKPKFEISPKQGLFLANALHFLKYKFGYENMCSWAKIKDEYIFLPTLDGEINFSFIEKFIEELEAQRVEELEAYLKATGLKDYELTKEEQEVITNFNLFTNSRTTNNIEIETLFEKLELKFLKNRFDKASDVSKIKTAEFDLPLVNAKDGDNGIMYYGRKKDFESATMTIDVVGDGAVSTGNVYAQPQETGVLYNAYLIKPKVEQVTRELLLFFATTIQKSIKGKYGYENKAGWNKVRLESISVPYSDHEINYKFIDDFMMGIQKLVIKDVVLWADKKIEATKSVVNR